jgi:hypothetical protein
MLLDSLPMYFYINTLALDHMFAFLLVYKFGLFRGL